jgi:two-component system catabolic regulation response regulator CreB
MGTAQVILVVDDEPSIADNIIYALTTEGFETVYAPTGSEALARLEAMSVDLIILDIGLPDINGFELARQIRRRSAVPIIFVTARSDEIDRIVGLELGADDYVVKPFSPRELSARVKAVLRRAQNVAADERKSTAPEELIHGPFKLDLLRYRASYHGTALVLSRVEFRLLGALLAAPGRVFSRDQLLDKAWEHGGISLERTVDTHIKTLRGKCKEISDRDPIVTHRGIGYSMRDDW